MKMAMGMVAAIEERPWALARARTTTSASTAMQW